jgi:hypothetical protein
MRVFRVILVLFCVWSVVDFVLAVHAIHPPQNGAHSSGRGALAVVQSLALGIASTLTLYGIHKRTIMVWKLGWGYLAAIYFEWLFTALPQMLKVPSADSPLAASAAVVVIGAVVTLYWGFWWYRQKGYFVKPVPTSNLRQRTGTSG